MERREELELEEARAREKERKKRKLNMMLAKLEDEVRGLAKIVGEEKQ